MTSDGLPSGLGVELTIDSILASLRLKGITVWRDRGQLRYRCVKGSVGPADLALLKEHKLKILAYLTGAEVSQSAPLSFSQIWHWRMFELEHRTSFRGSARAFRLLGTVDESALRSSLLQVVERHAALRTRIVKTSALPFQDISGAIEDRLRVYDLTGTTEQTGESQRIIDEIILEPVNFDCDPLFTVALMRLGAYEHVLLIAVDHMISDAISASIVFTDLLTLYGCAIDVVKERLPALAVQFAEFSTWQQHNKQNWVKCDGPYWDGLLRRGDLTRFPISSDALAEKGGLGVINFCLPQDVSAQLARFSRSNQMTMAQCSFGAYAAAVSLWCDMADIVVQSQTTGRGIPGLESTVGYFASLLGIGVHISARDTFGDLLLQVKEEYCRALERTDHSYMARQLDRGAFCRNVVFNWIPRRSLYGNSMSRHSELGISIEPMEFIHPLHDDSKNSVVMDLDPELILSDELDGIRGQICFAQTRFSSAEMSRLAQLFVQVLQTLSYETNSRVRDVVLTVTV